MTLLDWLTPWELSPTLILAFVVAGGLFIRGARVHRVGWPRHVFLWAGMVLLYL